MILDLKKNCPSKYNVSKLRGLELLHRGFPRKNQLYLASLKFFKILMRGNQ